MTALTVNYTSPNGPYAARYGAVTAAVNQAFNAWMTHFDVPAGAATINVTIANLGYNVLASAAPDGVVTVGKSGNQAVVMSGFGAEVATGAALSTAARSAQLNLDTSWFNADFANPDANAADIQRVIQHEIGHMLGFISTSYLYAAGLISPFTSTTTAFDKYLSYAGAAEFFSGPDAIAAEGGAVTMESNSIVHTYVPGRVSIMSYLDQASTIQPLDTAILRDTGLPILSTQEAAEHEATRLYLAALGRAPDAAGLMAYSRALLAGTSVGAAAAGFLASGEFAQLYGTNQPDGAFVSALYQNVLHRAADAGGLQTWTGALAGGLSRADLVVDFADSAENRAALEAHPNQSYSETAEAQAERLYDAAFGRAPDPVGYGNVSRALLAGTTLQQAALGFLQSQEFANRYGASPDNGAFVDALYRNTLHRAADAGGRALFLNALNSGLGRADLLADFSESAEHVANVIRQDNPAPGAMLTSAAAHLGSIPVLPASLVG